MNLATMIDVDGTNYRRPEVGKEKCLVGKLV
jgi:hypothetical protein